MAIVNRPETAGRWRLALVGAGSMREAALLLFNLVHVTVCTICRISFVCAQARIETEQRRAIGAADLTGIAHIEVDVWVILRRFMR